MPGPVFLEIAVDLLYPESIAEEWYLKESGVDKMTGAKGKAARFAMKAYLKRQFHMPRIELPTPNLDLDSLRGKVEDAIVDHAGKVAAALAKAERPALVIDALIGSVAMKTVPKAKPPSTMCQYQGRLWPVPSSPRALKRKEVATMPRKTPDMMRQEAIRV